MLRAIRELGASPNAASTERQVFKSTVPEPAPALKNAGEIGQAASLMFGLTFVASLSPVAALRLRWTTYRATRAGNAACCRVDSILRSQILIDLCQERSFAIT